ncbi:MAG: hypothetical protein Q4D91_01175 [Lautropia sp.]|nr:hypothetical protein [Lautropia sp.]
MFVLKAPSARVGLAAIVAAAGMAAVSQAQAADYLNSLELLSQDNFRSLSENVGSGISFKGIVPAEGLGITGFDINAFATAIEVKDRGLWRNASRGVEVDKWVPMTGVRLHKGLPGNVDVGGFYSQSSRDIKAYGGELRWAFIEGNTFLPAVAVRGSMSKLTGIDQLKLTTTGIDLSISKGILMFTPYAGIGKVWVQSTPQNVPGLKKESFSLNKAFIGLNINLGINLALEADRTGDVSSYSVKAGIRF